MIFAARLDIVNFDAFEYMEKVMLYPVDIKRFIDSGGALAWGIVPTGSFTGREAADQLLHKLEEGINFLEHRGIDRKVILRQSLITPACGMGSLTPQKSEAILKMLLNVSKKMRSAID
jgi:hypothetical protein